MEKIINRCLRKDPDRRFQHMAGVKVALEELKEESDSGKLTSIVQAATPVRRKSRWMWTLAGTAVLLTLEQANAFLRERYIAEFNRRFAKPAAEKGTAFRKCRRKDLDWVFSIQTERTVAHDNTVVLQNRFLQLDKTRFRNTLAGCTVTICEHLDGSLSVRWGPHLLTTVKAERDAGKDGARGALEISPKSRDSHFAHRPTPATRTLKTKARRRAA